MKIDKLRADDCWQFVPGFAQNEVVAAQAELNLRVKACEAVLAGSSTNLPFSDIKDINGVVGACNKANSLVQTFLNVARKRVRVS